MRKYLPALTLVLIVALVLFMNFYFFNYYFPGSSVDGSDVSWQKRTEETTMPIEEDFTITVPNLDKEFSILTDGLSRRLILPQKSLFTLKPIHLISEETIIYDETHLSKELEELLNDLPQNALAEDAKLFLKDGEIGLIPHKFGFDFPDKQRLLEMTKDSIAREDFDLDLDSFVHEPETFSRDLRPEMNHWKHLSLRNDDYSWVLEGEDLLSLYKEDFSLDEDKAKEVFESFFSEADEESTIWSVDLEDSFPFFIQALKNHAPSWDVNYGRVRSDPDPNYAMDNGIAISIDRQWLWFYSGGEVIFQAPIISGNPNRGYPTHRGYWNILSMDTDTRLANTNREGVSYDVAVSYWMQFNYEGMIEGIHDAPWQWAFGTDAYLWDGSHGCINVSPSDMPTLFSLSWVGLPVLVY